MFEELRENSVDSGHCIGEHMPFAEWETDVRGTATGGTELVAVPRAVFQEIFSLAAHLAENCDDVSA